MCDYSLESLRSRKAERNETLVLDRANATYGVGSKGFFAKPIAETATADVCAVCVAPGTVLSLDCPDGSCLFGVFTSDLASSAHSYRDGIITQGRSIKLQELEVGTKATIHMPAGVDVGELGPDHAAPEDADLASVNDPAPVLAA